MKMAKKFGAMLLAASMMICGSAVFAIDAPTVGEVASQTGETVSGGVKVTATGETVGATIDINMPTSMEFIINPYGLEDKEQIISPELTITNMGDTDVQVSLSELSATITGDAVLAAAPVDQTKSTKKEIFLFLKTKSADAENPYVAYDSKTDAGKVVKASGFKAVALDKLAKATKNDKDETVNGGSTTMKLMGSANGNMTWTETDVVTVAPVFTFAPCVIPATSTTTN